MGIMPNGICPCIQLVDASKGHSLIQVTQEALRIVVVNVDRKPCRLYSLPDEVFRPLPCQRCLAVARGSRHQRKQSLLNFSIEFLQTRPAEGIATIQWN